jgi:hypothetical protein
MTIRLASGGYIGGGLYHSQNIEGALATIPEYVLFIQRLLMMLRVSYGLLSAQRG